MPRPWFLDSGHTLDSGLFLDEKHTPAPPIAPNRPLVTVEVSFTPPGVSPQWIDISAYVRDEVRIRRGRTHELEQPEAGTATVVLDNRERIFDPLNSSGPYYGRLLPMRPVRIGALWEDVFYPQFSGFVEDWGQQWGPGLDAVCELVAVDGFKVLNLLKVNDLAAPQELSGKRIHRVLDYTGMSGVFVGQGYWVVGDPTASVLGQTTVLASHSLAFRLIDSGQSLICAGTISETALNHMQKVAEAEEGLLFIDAEGRLVFHSRHHRILQEQVPAASFGDIGDGTEWPYGDLELGYGDYWLYNEVRVSRENGVEQMASDAASKGQYLTRTLEKRNLLLASDSEALSRAQSLLLRYKEPQVRAKQMVLEPTGLGDLWPVVLGREVSNRVTVVRRPMAGSPIVGDYFIEAIDQDITEDSWTIRWQMTPAPVGNYWVLGEHELNRETRLAS